MKQHKHKFEISSDSGSRVMYGRKLIIKRDKSETKILRVVVEDHNGNMVGEVCGEIYSWAIFDNSVYDSKYERWN